MYFDDQIPEWATREFLSCCKHRDSLEKKSKISGSLADRCKYVKARNSVTNFKRNLKENFFQTAFNEAGDDPKKIWRVIRQLLGSGQKKSKIMEINGKSDPTEMADEINNFFADIGSNLTAELPDSMLEIDMAFRGNHEKFSFHQINDSDVRKLLRSMPVNKSTGVDGVPIRFLKMCEVVSVSVLTHIINLSLATMIVPNN